MLEFLNRHKLGILGTVLFHVFVVFWANYVYMPYLDNGGENLLVIEFPVEEEITPEELNESKPKQATDAESNKAVNESAPDDLKSGDYNEYNSESKDNYEKQLEEELKELEKQVIEDQREAGYGYSEEEIAEMLDSKKNHELDQVKEQKPRSEAAYKGGTNITYKLENRFDTRLKVPVYMCQYGGVVVINIAVDQNGAVVSAKLDKESSKTTDECLIKAALNGANNTRFNRKSSAPKIQMGSITYQFIAQ